MSILKRLFGGSSTPQVNVNKESLGAKMEIAAEKCSKCGATRSGAHEWVGCLSRALSEGDCGAVERLLNNGLDLNTKAGGDTQGWTILHRATHDGHLKLVKVLLDRGADVNARDNDRKTPLHSVMQQDHPQVVKLLLDRGALVNAKDQNGNTPLHSAAIVGDTEVVKLLIDRGADVNARNHEGATPLNWVLTPGPGHHIGRDEVVRLLKAHGAWSVSPELQRRLDSFRQWVKKHSAQDE